MSQTVVIGGRANSDLNDNWSNPTVYTTGERGENISSSPYTDISKITNSVGQYVNTTLGTNAIGLENVGISLGDSYKGLFDLINQTTQANNAWSAEQAQKQMDFQERQNQKAMDFNAAEAAKTRNWQELLSNTAHQREIADLKAAGLNPVLSATGGNGAAVTSGATASGVTSSGAKGDTDNSANAAVASIYGSLINAQTSMYNSNLNAQTNLKIAEMQQAASMYAAQLAADTARSSNPWQIISTIADNVVGDDSKRGSGAKTIGKTVSLGIDKVLDVVQNAAKIREASGPTRHSTSTRR